MDVIGRGYGLTMKVLNVPCHDVLQAAPSESAAGKAAKLAMTMSDLDVKKEAQAGRVGPLLRLLQNQEHHDTHLHNIKGVVSSTNSRAHVEISY